MNRIRGQELERPSLVKLFFWELKIGLRSRGVPFTICLFCLLLGIASTLGISRTEKRQSAARIAAQQNKTVEEIFTSILEGKTESIDDNQEKSSRQHRISKQLRMTARSPYLVSHANNLWNVSLFASPLNTISVGSCTNWPDRYDIHGMSLSNTIQREDQIRPRWNAYGPFDINFVVMVIAPLVVIGITFNCSSSDRESSRLNLLLAQTSSLAKLMLVRCFVRSCLVIASIVCVVVSFLAINLRSQFDVNITINLANWILAATLYVFIWGAISFVVNSFRKSSTFNGAVLLFLWMISVLIIPRFVAQTLQDSFPTAAESELAEREKKRIEIAGANIENLIMNFQNNNPETEIRPEDEQQMALVEYLLPFHYAWQDANAIVADHYSAQLKRAEYLNFLSWLSPAIAFNVASDHSSGNSDHAFIAFTQHAAETQAGVARVFLKPSITNQECTKETIDALPRFQDLQTARRISVSKMTMTLIPLVVWLLVLIGLGNRRFHQKSGLTVLPSPSKNRTESA